MYRTSHISKVTELLHVTSVIIHRFILSALNIVLLYWPLSTYTNQKNIGNFFFKYFHFLYRFHTVAINAAVATVDYHVYLILIEKVNNKLTFFHV